ncbi:MAG: biliverdin-producing heme oxygenase [Pseudomonadota bacterium]
MLPAENPELSAIAELRTATWPAHQRLDKRIDFKARLATAGTYRAHVAQMWGFYVGLEPSLGRGGLRHYLSDYESRHKAPLLERDLIAMGVERTAVAQYPRSDFTPDFEDPASAFGCAYVLEGATLGGRFLLPLVQTRLGLTAENGAAFLASYGEFVQERWRAFGAALDVCCAPERRRIRAAEAASATFTALEHWLCGSIA